MLKSVYLENMKLKTSFKDWTLHILSFQIDTIQLVTMSDTTDDETFEPSFNIGLSCPEYKGRGVQRDTPQQPMTFAGERIQNPSRKIKSC
jgi:hypothetical protein